MFVICYTLLDYMFVIIITTKQIYSPHFTKVFNSVTTNTSNSFFLKGDSRAFI